MALINREKFYKQFKLKFGSFTFKQYDGFEAILKEWEVRNLNDLRWLGYILATAWHETGGKMQPVVEIGHGRNKKYGQKFKKDGSAYIIPNQYYYGRGHVQLTWYENYQKMGILLKFDLLNNPESALDMETSVKIMFEGMLKAESSFGDFTGKSLENYFSKTANDAIGARKIINGTDKAQKIAQHYHDFLACL